MEHPVSSVQTAYGEIDREALQSLRGEYETRQLLDLIDHLDAVRHRFVSETMLRDDVLRLHRMAHSLLNGVPLTEPGGNPSIWETAQALSDELDALAELFCHATAIVKPLIVLKPDLDE